MSTKVPLTSASALIDKLHIVEDHRFDDFINSLLDTRSQKIVGFLNQHGFNLAAEDASVLGDFAQMDYLLRDGVGIKFACQWNKVSPGANLNGTDFIPALILKAQESDIEVDYFVFGTRSPWLEVGTGRLMNGQQCHTLHGFHDDQRYIDFLLKRVRKDALTVVVVAMGMPRQERLARTLRESLEGPALFICGGAIIDFQAGRFKRAPALVRRFNLEWMFRLVSEPRRLFRRYILGIPKFIYYLVVNR
jgi:beta-1,4-glucosyltransferase